MTVLADLRCEVCGSPEVALIEPGTDAEKAADLFQLTRGTPIRCRCLEHWKIVEAKPKAGKQ